jgi:D-alanyl-lipoteichoic acid acyltransferase DltB (MBOAT superfamily)
MLFNSFEFLVFLPIVLLAAHWLRGSHREWMLLAASYVFYMFWSIPLAGLLLFSSVLDFWVSRRMGGTDSPAQRKVLLLVSLSLNLGLLVFFKYTNFLLSAGSDILALFGVQRQAPVLDITLPLGISFYTFQTLSYTIDVYRRHLEPCASLRKFCLYVSFFPQLVAGPIVRASDFLPQLDTEKRATSEAKREAWLLVAVGFLKKMVLADNIAPFVNDVYAAPTSVDGNILLLATYAFAFQIYLDFSGYSDIARGLAKLLGYELTLNFDKPYFATSITDFWRRWHISLSSWLRDYLYISLGGNRGGRLLTYRNLLLTMILGGIWHGAAWTFVIWGVFHGVVLALERAIPWRFPLSVDTVSGKLVRQIWTFHLVCVSWVFFRAASVADAKAILLGIVGGSWDGSPSIGAVVALCLAGLTVAAMAADTGSRLYHRALALQGTWRSTLLWFSAMVIVGFGVWTRAEFIYFQF